MSISTLSVEIADSWFSRMRGLMGRTALPDRGGMLFVYEDEEPIWQYLRGAFLFNRVFEDYAVILDAGCQAWKSLVDNSTIIHSIGMREWAHKGGI